MWDSLMDGDHRMKQHEALMARSGNASASGHVPDPFDSNMHPRGMRGAGGGSDATGMSQAPDRAQMAYDYGYTGGSFHGGSLQNDVVAYGSEPTRRATASSQQSAQRRRRASYEQQSQHQQHQHPSLVPYESAMLYSFHPQQGPTQGGGSAFEVVPQYSIRQSAAMEALSNQFAIPPYFNPEETSTTGVPGLSPYLNAHQPYNHPGSMQRPNNTAQPFPTTMTDFSSIGTCSASRIDTQPMNQSTESATQPQSDHDTSSLEEAYSQYQRALCATFDHTRAGRLLDASRSLLEISEWLVTNARDLGILREDHLYKDRLQLWNDFNLCWLAVCQKQKDLTQDFATSGSRSTQASLLSRDRMESMGRELIQLCDQLEQYGLVDYQIGIWEEEILCVLGQCLDLMESRPELLRIQTVLEPTTAAPRPRS